MDNNNDIDFDKLDPVAQFIISFLKTNNSVSTETIAKEFSKFKNKDKDKDDKNAWRKYLNTVKQQSIFLARNKIIEIIRKGEVVDTEDFKGLVKLQLKNNNK